MHRIVAIFYLAALAGLASCAAFRPTGQPPAHRWQLVYTDDFAREQLGESWRVVGGEWTIADGILQARGDSVADYQGPAQLAFAEPILGPQRIEFRARSADPADLSAFLQGYRRGDRFGYLLQFGASRNTINAICRDGRRVKVSGEGRPVVPGAWHEIAAEFDGQYARLTVDGRLALEYRETEEPLLGPHNAEAGFYVWGEGEIDRVRIYAEKEPLARARFASRIEKARGLLDGVEAGEDPGRYPAEAVAAFRGALETSEAVAKDPGSGWREFAFQAGELERAASLFRWSAVPDPDLERLERRLAARLAGVRVPPGRAEALAESLGPDGRWPDIDYEDVSRTGWEHRRHLANILLMSRAFRQEKHPLAGDDGLERAILLALDYWFENRFTADNWTQDEQLVPCAMTDILLLVKNRLDGPRFHEGARISARAHFDARPARPGGDYMHVLTIAARRGVLTGDAELVRESIARMADDIEITTGRGIQPDLSYHHRREAILHTTSYGLIPLEQLTPWLSLVAGTDFSFPEDKVRLLVDYYLDGVCRTKVHGLYHDPGAMSREIARQNALRARGPGLPETLLAGTGYRAAELGRLAAVRRGRREPDYSFNRAFWRSDYMSHQRPGWFASVRMYSTRVFNNEAINMEGILGHHTADGACFISRTGREYDGLPPVMDWQMVPGTTVVRKPALPGWREVNRRGLADFAGGVSDGLYGAAGFDFASPHDPLRARKAWFFFDDGFVALGAGIRSESGYPVITTVNQCLLEGPVTAGLAGREALLPPGTHSLEGVSWVHHDRVAYIFPSPGDARVRNEEVTGSWRRVNRRFSAGHEEISREVFSLWFEHGTGPERAGYEYIVVPGLEPGQAAAWSESPPVEIIANGENIQAVYHRAPGILQAVFYRPGRLEIPGGGFFRTEQPGIFMVSTAGGEITGIALADPAGKLERMEITVSGDLKLGESLARLASRSRDGRHLFSVTLPAGGLAGKTVLLPGED